MTTTLPAGWKPRLSCPFCGSNCLFTEPDEVGSGGQWVSPIHVGCNDCQAEQVGDTEDEAVSRWNARFTPSASAQPARDWELDCDHCNGSGHVFVKHQVAELKTDVQEFKEECECCEGRGFVFAFQDIPEIEEYVKSCRPAIQHEPITVSLDPDPRGVSVGVWQGSHCIYNGAHAVPSAQDDAKDDGITPADAVYGLMAWLSGRDEVVTLSSRHGAAIAAELANAFCNENGLQKFSQGYPDNLKYPTTSLAQQHDAKDERQAFEEWFTRNDETKDIAERAVRRSPSGAYVLMQTYTAWDIWQAARASVAAPAAGDARGAARWRFIRRKLCLTGNGDGTCAMQAINLPASVPGWPEPGPAVAEFCDAAIDAAISSQHGEGGAA